VIILDVEQGSEEWHEGRAGRVTGTGFENIVSQTGKPTTGARRTTYMNKLLSEWLAGLPADMFKSYWMERGNILEPEARGLYAMLKDVDPVQIGLVYKDEQRLVSCSPDALVGENGLWEGNAPAPHTHIGYLLNNQMVNQYIPKVQGRDLLPRIAAFTDSGIS